MKASYSSSYQKPNYKEHVTRIKAHLKKGNPQTELKTNKQINMRALIGPFDTLSASD